jgi:hypothetical protein
MPVGMNVHPPGSDRREHVDAAPQLLEGCSPDFLNTTGDRQVECGVANDAESMAVERLAHAFTIDSPRSRHRRLQRQVNESQAERCNPLDLL